MLLFHAFKLHLYNAQLARIQWPFAAGQFTYLAPFNGRRVAAEFGGWTIPIRSSAEKTRPAGSRI